MKLILLSAGFANNATNGVITIYADEVECQTKVRYDRFAASLVGRCGIYDDGLVRITSMSHPALTLGGRTPSEVSQDRPEKVVWFMPGTNDQGREFPRNWHEEQRLAECHKYCGAAFLLLRAAKSNWSTAGGLPWTTRSS